MYLRATAREETRINRRRGRALNFVKRKTYDTVNIIATRAVIFAAEERRRAEAPVSSGGDELLLELRDASSTSSIFRRLLFSNNAARARARLSPVLLYTPARNLDLARSTKSRVPFIDHCRPMERVARLLASRHNGHRLWKCERYVALKAARVSARHVEVRPRSNGRAPFRRVCQTFEPLASERRNWREPGDKLGLIGSGA